MLKILSTEFFLPTKKFRSLSVLLAIHHNNNISQHAIGVEVGMSSSMVNGYIKTLSQDGFIHIENKNGRDKVYELSPKGRGLLTEYLLTCSAEIVRLYSRAKEELVAKLHSCFTGKGVYKVILYGGAETAQLVLNTLEQFDNVKVIAVVDRDPEKWGERLQSHIIQRPEIIDDVEFNTVIISSFAKQEEIYAQLNDVLKQKTTIIRLSECQVENENEN